MRLTKSRLRRVIRQVINENVKNTPEMMINVDPLINEIMKLSKEEIDYLIIRIAPLIFSREKLLGIS